MDVSVFSLQEAMNSTEVSSKNGNTTQENDTETIFSNAQVTLLIENPKKNTNWGPLLRCCAAFGIAQIFVVGYDTCSVQGSHGASKHVELLSFPTYGQAVGTLKKHNFELIGLLGSAANAYDETGHLVHLLEQPMHHSDKTKTETVVAISENSTKTDQNKMPKSYPIHSRPFQQNTCLVVGRKTVGLPMRMAGHCAKFVHIPHLAALKTKSDVDGTANDPNLSSWFSGEACVSMVLHEFASWAGFHSEIYKGQKYTVLKVIKGAPDDQEAKRNERKRKMEELQQEEEGNAKSLFGASGDDGDY